MPAGCWPPQGRTRPRMSSRYGRRTGRYRWGSRAGMRNWLPTAWGSGRRARLRPEGGGWSIQAADGSGAPVITVRSLVLRPVAAGQLEEPRNVRPDALFSVAWVPVPGQEPGGRELTVMIGDDIFGVVAGL